MGRRVAVLASGLAAKAMIAQLMRCGRVIPLSRNEWVIGKYTIIHMDLSLGHVFQDHRPRQGPKPQDNQIRVETRHRARATVPYDFVPVSCMIVYKVHNTTLLGAL